jgi:MFS family permease
LRKPFASFATLRLYFFTAEKFIFFSINPSLSVSLHKKKGLLLSERFHTVKTSFALTYRSLRHPNYRLFFWGQSVSQMGTWIQNIAIGWLVYRLTGSAIYLGIIAFAGQIPSLFITPLAGVYADRFNRRKVLVITQILAMVTAITLALFVLFDIITIAYLLVFAVIAGMINAFDTPFRQAIVLELIGNREDLPNAIALNSSLYNTARFIGPLIGGVLISLVGEGWCFMINGLSFLAVVLSLMKMQMPPFEPVTQTRSLLWQLVEGVTYAWTYKPIRYLIMLVAAFGLMALPFQALLPAFAADVLNGDATLLGTLTGSLGAGALLGALYLASRSRMHSLPRNIFVFGVMLASGLAVFSQSTSILLSMSALFVAGFGMITLFNATNTLLQAISDEDKRGRVVSLYSLSFMGLTPIGSLIAGALAEFSSVMFTVLVGSLICLLVGVLLQKKIKSVKPLL